MGKLVGWSACDIAIDFESDDPPTRYREVVLTLSKFGLVTWVALGALKVAEIAEIHWMDERLVGLVAGLTFAICKCAQIDRMLKRLRLYGRAGIC